jgi:hypothetical protein
MDPDGTKIKFPFIFRTPVEDLATYTFTAADREAAWRILDRRAMTEQLIDAMERHPDVPMPGTDVEDAIDDSLAHRIGQIGRRLMVADQMGAPFLSAGGFLPDPTAPTGKRYVQPREDDQTEALPPTLCKGELHCTVELRNHPAFRDMHATHQGAPVARPSQPPPPPPSQSVAATPPPAHRERIATETDSEPGSGEDLPLLGSGADSGDYLPLQSSQSNSGDSSSSNAPDEIDQQNAIDEALGLQKGSADFRDMEWVAPKPRGIAGGAIYMDPSADRWLIKSYPFNRGAVNEHVAFNLYRAAGLNVPDTKLVELEGAHHGGTGIASKWIDGLERYSRTAQQQQAYSDFAFHAWLGAEDVHGGNISMQGDRLIYPDAGCSLYCTPLGYLKVGGLPARYAPKEGLSEFRDMQQAEFERSAQKFGAVEGTLTRENLEVLAAPYGGLAGELADTLRSRADSLLAYDFNRGPDSITWSLGIPEAQYGPDLRRKRTTADADVQRLTDKQFVAIRDFATLDDAMADDGTSPERTDDQLRNGVREAWRGVDRLNAGKPSSKLGKSFTNDVDVGALPDAGEEYRAPSFVSASTHPGAWSSVLFAHSGADITNILPPGASNHVLFSPGARFNVLAIDGDRMAALEEWDAPAGAGHLDNQRFINGLIDTIKPVPQYDRALSLPLDDI